MKRQSLTKCLQLAHNFNDQEVIDLISSKYRVAKVVVAKINVPPVPDQESWILYNINTNMAGSKIDEVMRIFATMNPSSSLFSDKSMAGKVARKINHCELWLQYEEDKASLTPEIRNQAEKRYAEKYKELIDPSWEVGELDEEKKPSGSKEGLYLIHQYIMEDMQAWFRELNPKDKKFGPDKIKQTEEANILNNYNSWWKGLPESYKDNDLVVSALNALHTVYLEPESYSEANSKHRIITSEIDPRYSRMIPKQVSLYNLGLESNEFPLFGPNDIKLDGVNYTYHNPDKLNINTLIKNLQDALLGIVKKEPKQPDTTDYTKGLKFISNIMGYQGGRV